MGVVNFEYLNQDYTICKVADIFINKVFIKVLEKNDLCLFDKVISYSKGEVFRENSVRCVRKIELQDDDGKKHIFHLKTHKLNVFEIIKSFFRLGDLEDGFNEWSKILLLESLNIKTMVPVSFGESKKFGVPYKSFTMTEHLYDALRLEEYISINFKDNMTKDKILLKRKITKELADIAFNFHKSGFNHNDFYLGHFFINLNDFTLNIIDLQRVHQRNQIRDRDRIKDIAQLYFSATQIFKEKRLKDINSVFINKVFRKNLRIAKHTKKVLGL